MGKKYGKIYIVAGPIFYSNKYKTVGERKVAVPDAFSKWFFELAKLRKQQKQ